jgi:hypothetical protein
VFGYQTLDRERPQAANNRQAAGASSPAMSSVETSKGSMFHAAAYIDVIIE